MSETRVNVRIDPEIREMFYQKVNSEGKTVTNVILELITQYLKNKQPESGELSQVMERIEKLEKLVLGETNAWERKANFLKQKINLSGS